MGIIDRLFRSEEIASLIGRIPLTHEEEELSQAYVRLVACRAGVSIFNSRVEYGLDGIFKPVYRVTTLRPKKASKNPKAGKSPGMKAPLNSADTAVEFQIKATFNWTATADMVKFDLDADDYDRLIDVDGRAKPILLILFCLPTNKDEWLEVDEEKLLLRKCCYFHYLEGNKTKNKSKVSVSVPRQNVFTPDALRQLVGG